MRKSAHLATWVKGKLTPSGRTGDGSAPSTAPPGGRLTTPRTPRGQRLLALASGGLVLAGLIGAGTAAGAWHAGTTPAGDVKAAPARNPSLLALDVGAPKGAKTLPAAPAHDPNAAPANAQVIDGLAANGIPNVALNAYRVAAARMGTADPGCGIDWSLLAGIGRVESNHGRYGGAVLSTDGNSNPRILGPQLNGNGFAYIADTDHGIWDTDTVYDRAVGPMQFIPGTWRSYGIAANGSGIGNPNNINDAALAAAHYLCVAGGDLHSYDGQRRAVLAYNHSDSYVAEVLSLAAAYAAGIPVADLPPMVGNTNGPVPPPSGAFVGAPAAPGPAIGRQDTTRSPDVEPTTYPSSQPGGQPAQPAAQGGAQPAATAGDQSGGGGNGSGGGGGGGGGGTPPGTTPAGNGSSGGGGNPAPSGGGGGGGNPLPAAPALPVPLPTQQPPAPAPAPAPTPTPTPAPPPPPILLAFTDPICVANRTLGQPIPLGYVCPSS